MGLTTDRVLRVVSVPSGHPYVRHLSSSDRVERLPDPLPDGAGPGVWWPPVVLDPAWIREHSEAFDVLHVHFGTESFTTAHLEAVLVELETARIPLVYTVHDLANPQLTDQSEHLAHLDLLVPAADEVITLTPGAAAEIARRWGREATVIPHPNVLPIDAAFPASRTVGPSVIGVHLRDLRPNIDAVGTVTTLIAAVELLRTEGTDVVARIDLNERVRDALLRDEVRALAVAGGAELVEHPRLSDDDLAFSLAALEVSVLPYRHGTHSGWVELCFDLAVPVAGPRVGFASEQHRDAGFFAAFDIGDPASLAAAVRELMETPVDRAALQQARRAGRARERVGIDEAHIAVYERALAAASARRSAVIGTAATVGTSATTATAATAGTTTAPAATAPAGVLEGSGATR